MINGHIPDIRFNLVNFETRLEDIAKVEMNLLKLTYCTNRVTLSLGYIMVENCGTSLDQYSPFAQVSYLDDLDLRSVCVLAYLHVTTATF